MNKKNLGLNPAFFSGNLFDPANYEEPQFGPDDLIVNPDSGNDLNNLMEAPQEAQESTNLNIADTNESLNVDQDDSAPLGAAERYQQILDNYRERIKDARSDRRRTNLMAGLSDAANTIAGGMAASYGGQIRDPQTGNMLRRNAAERASDVESDLKVDLSGLSGEQRFVKADMDLQNEKELNNPDSAISDIYRKTAKMLAPGINEDALNKATAAQLAQAIPGLHTYANARLRQEMTRDRLGQQEAMLSQRQAEESRRKNEKIYGVVKDFEKDDLNKELKKQGLAFKQADSLIDSMKAGNEVALGALGTKMARAMGEVGVLTDTDVQRYITAASAIQKSQDLISKYLQGDLSDKTVKNLYDVIEKMGSGFEKEKTRVQDKYINYAYENFGKPFNMSREEVVRRFNVIPKTSSDVSTIEEVRRKTKDGRIAIFNANTKQFIRYEE